MAAPFAKMLLDKSKLSNKIAHGDFYLKYLHLAYAVRQHSTVLQLNTRNRVCKCPNHKHWIDSRLTGGTFSSEVSRRHFNKSTDDEGGEKRIRGFVFPVQSPLKWMWKHIGLFLFQKVDPDFDKREFIEGAKQAVSHITHQFYIQNYSDLKGLASNKLLGKLEDAVSSVILGGRQNIAIRVEDVVYADVKGVKVTQQQDLTSVDVDVLLVAIKMSRNVQLLIDMSFRFGREYGGDGAAEWQVRDLVAIHCRELLRTEE